MAAVTLRWNGPVVPDPGNGDLPAGAVAFTGASRTSNVVTATLPAGHPLTVGQRVIVSAADTSYNGTFTISGITATTATWAQVAVDDASSGAGTATPDPLQGGFLHNSSTQVTGWRAKLVTDGYAF